MWGVELDNIPGQCGGRTRQYTWIMWGVELDFEELRMMMEA